MIAPVLPEGLEDQVRLEALARYLEGDEEQALDLLTFARAMAEPIARIERMKT